MSDGQSPQHGSGATMTIHHFDIRLAVAPTKAASAAC
jgi:hypothetical protein